MVTHKTVKTVKSLILRRKGEAVVGLSAIKSGFYHIVCT
jgi:hypothetical protein